MGDIFMSSVDYLTRFQVGDLQSKSEEKEDKSIDATRKYRRVEMTYVMQGMTESFFLIAVSVARTSVKNKKKSKSHS